MIIIDEIFEGFYLIYEITIGTILEGIHNLFWLLAIVGIIAAPIYFYKNVAKHREAERIAAMVEYVIPAPAQPRKSHLIKVLSKQEYEDITRPYSEDINRFVKTKETARLWGHDLRDGNTRLWWVTSVGEPNGEGWLLGEYPTICYHKGLLNSWQLSPNRKWMAFIVTGRNRYNFQSPDTIYIAPVSKTPVQATAVAYTFSSFIRWTANGRCLVLTGSNGPWEYDPKNSSIRVSRGSVSTTTELRYINWQ